MGEGMKTPEEIKRELITPETFCDHCSYNGEPNGCNHPDGPCQAWTSADDAYELIQQLEAQVPKWIRVEERLPEISDVVLVIASGKPRENIELHDAFLIASFWGDEGWIADGYEEWDAVNVTHWMPLPPAPKEG